MRRFILWTSLVVLTAAIPSEASTIQFNAIVDISACHGVGICNELTPMPAQTIAVGDVVDFTVTFADSERLLMQDVGGPTNENFFGWLNDVSASGNFTISNASMTLLGQQGALLAPLSLATQTSGVVHLGPAFNGDYIASGSSVSFSGYRVLFTVDALPANPTTYGNVWTLFTADRLEVVSAVPEPASTVSLLVMGLAGVGFGRWRRRR